MDSLVTTDWLAGQIGAPKLAILDASMHLPAAGRDAVAEFAAAHIPGARFLNLASFRDTASSLPNTLPTVAQAADRLAALGLSPEDRVVLYDDSALRSAARAWFVLRGFGFRQLAILDGGLAKWRGEGRRVETGVPAPTPGAMPPLRFDAPVRTKTAMLANLSARTEQVVDARDPARFSAAEADTVHGLAGGHIPGARNLFYRDLYREDGTLRSADDVRAAFAAAGIDLARPVTASCGSGVTAAPVLFALHRLGVEGALYDGSWSEWGADPETPKETGAS